MCAGGAGEARRGRRVAGRRDKRERNVSGRWTDRQTASHSGGHRGHYKQQRGPGSKLSGVGEGAPLGGRRALLPRPSLPLHGRGSAGSGPQLLTPAGRAMNRGGSLGRGAGPWSPVPQHELRCVSSGGDRRPRRGWKELGTRELPLPTPPQGGGPPHPWDCQSFLSPDLTDPPPSPLELPTPHWPHDGTSPAHARAVNPPLSSAPSPPTPNHRGAPTTAANQASGRALPESVNHLGPSCQRGPAPELSIISWLHDVHRFSHQL